MRTIYSASKARTHFYKLLGLANKGGEILITKYGESIAKLVPYEEKKTNDIRAAIRHMEKIAKKGKPLGMSIRTLRDKGRP